MKVSLDRSCFLKALSHAQSVVEKKNTIPILAHVLLEAADGFLKLTATDLELTIVETIQADVIAPLSVTVSAHMLHDIVRKLPEDVPVVLTVDGDGDRLTLTAARSQFVLACLPVCDFPAIHTAALPYFFRLAARDLYRLLDKTRFAVSVDETRYAMNGIYFHPYQDTELRAVATDGHRLARVGVPLPDGAAGFSGVIFSRKMVNEILKVLTDRDEDVSVSLSPTQVSFEFKDVYITSRLVDGTFPDYHQVIPLQNDKLLHLDVAAFSKAVDRVATISAEKNRGVKILLESGKLTLLAASSDLGTATEEIEVDYDSDPLDIGFNARYLLDIAQQMGDSESELAFFDAASPITLRPSADPSVLYVLMPMRV
jgi:DNA polymerase-3 subunit beta